MIFSSPAKFIDKNLLLKRNTHTCTCTYYARACGFLSINGDTIFIHTCTFTVHLYILTNKAECLNIKYQNKGSNILLVYLNRPR